MIIVLELLSGVLKTLAPEQHFGTKQNFIFYSLLSERSGTIINYQLLGWRVSKKLTSLQDLGLKHGTDKATYHNFLNFYEKHIDRVKVKRFLEIGVHQGASLKMWREYFDSKTIVEGWDVVSCDNLQGCDIRIVDQNSKESMGQNVTGVYDVILDDGGHTTQMIENSFAKLFRYSRIYIIEDLHAPWCGKYYTNNDDLPTIGYLLGLNKFGWISQYATKEEREYINDFAHIKEFYFKSNSIQIKIIKFLLKIVLRMLVGNFPRGLINFTLFIVYKLKIDSVSVVIENRDLFAN
jgi:hypothetical protein